MPGGGRPGGLRQRLGRDGAAIPPHRVVQVDVDNNGISIGATALTLNSGTIVRDGGTENAQLRLGNGVFFMDSGTRWDGGKAEMGGGVEYAHTRLGLGIKARGRYLLAHQKAAFDEWGQPDVEAGSWRGEARPVVGVGDGVGGGSKSGGADVGQRGRTAC